jgi:hypothetical protein
VLLLYGLILLLDGGTQVGVDRSEVGDALVLGFDVGLHGLDVGNVGSDTIQFLLRLRDLLLLLLNTLLGILDFLFLF